MVIHAYIMYVYDNVDFFSGLNEEQEVLLTHSDEATRVAPNFKITAKCGNIIAGTFLLDFLLFIESNQSDMLAVYIVVKFYHIKCSCQASMNGRLSAAILIEDKYFCPNFGAGACYMEI